MQCPHCSHTSDNTALLKCAACGTAYARGQLETLQHLDYLLQWLEGDPAGISPQALTGLLAHATEQRAQAYAALGLSAPTVTQPTAAPVVPAPKVASAAPVAPTPSAKPVARAAKAAHAMALILGIKARLNVWGQAANLSKSEVQQLHGLLQLWTDELRPSVTVAPEDLPAVTEREVIEDALETLPDWALVSLRPHLQAVLRGLIETPRSGPAHAAHAVARQLALIIGIKTRLSRWAEAVNLSQSELRQIHDFLTAHANTLRQQAEVTPEDLPVVPENEIIEYALLTLPGWALVSLRPHLQKLLRELTMPAAPKVSMTTTSSAAPVTPTPAKPVAPAPKPIAPAKPITPPPPPTPPIDWGKVWERAWGLVVSGALLRGLLYLGALMIVASAVVLVVVYWAALPLVLRVLFVAAVPLAFYGGGFFLRVQLKIPVAGEVFTGIGALLVAVDFAAIYQIAGLTLNTNLYWLIASVLCTAIYVFTAWRVRGDFFAYITLLAGGSVALALANVLNAPLHWQVAVISGYGVGLVALAITWREINFALLGRAARYLSILLFGGTGFIALVMQWFIGGETLWAAAVNFGLEAVGLGLMAWAFPATWALVLAVGASVLGVGAAMLASPLPRAWYATGVAVLAPLYVAASWALERRLPESFKLRGSYLRVLNWAGGLLTLFAALLGVLSGLENVWAAVAAWALSSVVMAGYAYRFRQPDWVFVASGLFIAPVAVAATQLLWDANELQWLAWLAVTGTGLALIYLGLARALRPAPKYGAWLALWAQALLPVGLIVLFVNYAVLFPQWYNVPTLIALASVGVVYGASVILHHRGRDEALSQWVKWLPALLHRPIFLIPISVLLPVIISIAWLGSVLQAEWLSAVLAGLALVYVGVGLGLVRLAKEYRWPWHALAYPLMAIGPLLLPSETWPLMVTFYVDVVTLAALAFVYQRPLELAVAAPLLLWPFHLSLNLSPLLPFAHTLAYMLLASLAYIPIGLRLQRAGMKFALPVYAVGYAVSGLALAVSLMTRFFNLTPLTSVPWIAMVVPLIASGLYLFSAYRFQQRPFAWAVALAFPIAFGQALTLLNIRADYDALAWVGLGVAYMLTERGLQRTPEKHWARLLTQPLGLGAIVLTAGALVWITPNIGAAFAGRFGADMLPYILALTLATAQTMLAARLYRSQWPLYIEPGLAFVAVTLVFIAYTALTNVQFAWVWAGLGLAHLLAAVPLDVSPKRYARGVYLGAYGLLTFALVWSLGNRFVNLWVLGVVIGAALVSHWLAHRGLHRTFAEVLKAVWRKPDTLEARAARTFFLFVAAYGFPFWLAQLLTYLDVEFAWRGLAFALTAPIYIALGLAVRRIRADDTWPLYSAGYALTALGAMMAFDNERLAIAVLALDAVVYAVSAYIFQKAFWLYLSNALTPFIILLTLHYNNALTAPWVAGLLMALAWTYFLLGQVFDVWSTDGTEGTDETKKIRSIRPFNPLHPLTKVSSFALAFYAPSYVVSAVALAVASNDKVLALELYSIGVVLYALSAWRFREALFVYPAAWLAAVPYFVLMTFTPLPTEWYGLGWLPLIIAYMALARLVFQRGPLGWAWHWRAALGTLTQSAMPFYLLAYGLSISMVVVSGGAAWPLTLASLAAALLYFISAALFRRVAWVYPALLVTHLTVLAALTITPSDKPLHYISPIFMGLTWLIALAGYGFSRRAHVEPTGFPALQHLLTPSWPQPFLIFSGLGVVGWQTLALQGHDTGLIVAVGFALLLAVLATLWQDVALVYGALAFTSLAVGVTAHWYALDWPTALALFSGVSAAFYFLGRIVEMLSKPIKALAVWTLPLTYAGLGLALVMAALNLFNVSSETSLSAASLTGAGVVYLAHAYRGRYYRLSYAAVAMLELAWVLVLAANDIAEPQWYALPLGLYLAGVGFMERQRGQKTLALAIENLGFAVLLLTSFVQSLEGGAAGLPYFVALLVEAFLVIGWGAWRRLKVPFFIGLGASVLNVIGQIIVLFSSSESALIRWAIIGSAGIFIVILAVFVERQRLLIIAKAQAWREALETWD